MPPDSKDVKIESNDQEDSASAGKNTVALVPRLYMAVHPYSYFR